MGARVAMPAVAIALVLAFARPALADPSAACGAGAPALAGRLAAAYAGHDARIVVLPDTDAGRAYVRDLRDAVAARSPLAAITLVANRATIVRDADAVRGTMRVAVAGGDGRFRCGGLEPGAFLAIAFVAADRAATGPIDPRNMYLLFASGSVERARTSGALTGWQFLGGPR